MNAVNNENAESNKDWLDRTSPFPPWPVPRFGIPYGASDLPPADKILPCPWLDAEGLLQARETTSLSLSWDTDAVRIHAVCSTGCMDRVRAAVAESAAPDRDSFGADALEIHIDAGLTRKRFFHFQFFPAGEVVTSIGGTNLILQGYHPDVRSEVTLQEDAWVIEAEIPMAAFEAAARPGDVWGFNAMRVNPDEPGGYVQWAPTGDDAIRPGLFGQIEFLADGAAAGTAERQAARRGEEVQAYRRRAAARREFFQTAIHNVTVADVPDALKDKNLFDRWGRYIADRTSPVPVRWEALVPGADGLLPIDHIKRVERAEKLAERIDSWYRTDDPTAAPPGVQLTECLADAWLLTGKTDVTATFAQVIHAFESHRAARYGDLERPEGPLYPDSQVTDAVFCVYAYLNLAKLNSFDEDLHAAMLRLILRAGRFAAFNISNAYEYGNHQVYESSGLAILAALFPEFRESDSWAQISGRAILYHMQREVYDDGAWAERCGYHNVAQGFTTQAMMAVQVNHAESRFPELTAAREYVEKMYAWALSMMAPDGTFPAFGDCGASSMLRFFHQACVLFDRNDFAWPLEQLAAELVPQSITPVCPEKTSVHMPSSQFTIMRSDWTPDAFYMAVDHGPLGGQHCHVDTLGLVAYGYGVPLILDCGIGTTYEDPRYIEWFRSIRAHNTIAIDDVTPEKTAEATFWNSTPEADLLMMRSTGYEWRCGVTHDRAIVFVKTGLWFVCDRILMQDPEHRIEWHFHSPMSLSAGSRGVICGKSKGTDVGLLIQSAAPDDMESPVITADDCAVPLQGDARLQRMMDAVNQHRDECTQPADHLIWRRKPTDENTIVQGVLLAPYRKTPPEFKIESVPTEDKTAGFRLSDRSGTDLVIGVDFDGRGPLTVEGV